MKNIKILQLNKDYKEFSAVGIFYLKKGGR